MSWTFANLADGLRLRTGMSEDEAKRLVEENLARVILFREEHLYGVVMMLVKLCEPEASSVSEDTLVATVRDWTKKTNWQPKTDDEYASEYYYV